MITRYTYFPSYNYLGSKIVDCSYQNSNLELTIKYFFV